MPSLKQLKTEFLEYVEIEKGRSLNTVENYDRYLTKFFNFLKSDNPEDINEKSIREYRLWLNRQPNTAWKKKSVLQKSTNTENNLSKKTQNFYLIALRSFLKYIAKRGVKSLPGEHIELAKTSERTLDLITNEELERLLNAPFLDIKNKDSIKSLRDKAIIELLFSTGLRVSELCSLNRDINLKTSEFSVRGKGGKVRVVFISDEARNAVNKYLDARKDMGEALFTRMGKEKSNAGDYLNRNSIERIIKHYATIAGISKKVTPHTMRHMFATDLLSNGADIRSVQALLGHSSIITTQIYTHTTDKQLRETHQKFHNKK